MQCHKLKSVQEKTVSFYRKKVGEVVEYIHNHLADDLTIRNLAEQSGISFFHFHRIVQAEIGEPLGSYINRVRLDTAVKLIRYSDESFTSIAERVGYGDLSAFSKSFCKEFGLSPQDYRMNKTMVLNTHVDFCLSQDGNLMADLHHKTVSVPDKQVVYIRIRGEYGNDEAYQVWSELVEFALKNRLLTWRPEYLTYYYGDPDTIGFENCFSDLCIVVHKKINGTSRIGNGKMEGGCYVVFRFKGPYERLWDVYRSIYRILLNDRSIRLADRPPFEKYLNYSDHIKPENLLTEIYIPIE